MELHSERESFRKALSFRTPDGSVATLIVTRRNKRVWLTFDGAEKTTVAMTDPQTDDLVATLVTARGGGD